MMESIIERLCNEPIGNYEEAHAPDSIFVQTARAKCENLDKLMAGLSETQKELFEAVTEGDGAIEGMISDKKARYAFRLGALIMLEVMEGREEMFK